MWTQPGPGSGVMHGPVLTGVWEDVDTGPQKQATRASSEPRTGKKPGTERMLAEWGTAQDPANPAEGMSADWKGSRDLANSFIHPFLQ